MKHFIVNIEQNTVTVDGETCNFVEAGLFDNEDGHGQTMTYTNPDEIREALEESEEGEIKVTFVG